MPWMTAGKAERDDEEVAALQSQQDGEEMPPGGRPVVFVLPGISGEGDPLFEGFWAPLRSRFDVVLVTYLDWVDLIETGCDLTVLAAHVRRQIDGRMPSGRIRMAGYSLGGHLAFAIALGLEEEGREVESIAILDIWVDISGFPMPLKKRLLARLEALLTFTLRGGLASLLSKCLVRDEARPLLRRLSRFRKTPLPFGLDKPLHHKITMQLVRRLHPVWWRSLLPNAAPLRTPTLLLRSEQHESFEPEDLGWGQYCLDLRVIPVTGSHRSMFGPPNDVAFRAALAAALMGSDDRDSLSMEPIHLRPHREVDPA